MEKCKMIEIEEMLYEGEWEALTVHPYLLEALCDPMSAAKEMLSGYETNLDWDDICQNQVLNEEHIITYLPFLNESLLLDYQDISEDVRIKMDGERTRLWEGKKTNLLQKDMPLYIITKHYAGVKKLTDHTEVIVNPSVQVIGRITYVDDSKIILDSSDHFRSIVFEIPVNGISDFGYICDMPR